VWSVEGFWKPTQWGLRMPINLITSKNSVDTWQMPRTFMVIGQA
jgi:hypothetical protein